MRYIKHFKLEITPYRYAKEKADAMRIEIISDQDRYSFTKVFVWDDFQSYFDQIFDEAKRALLEEINKTQEG